MICFDCIFLLSPSTRRVWIEILAEKYISIEVGSPSTRRVWIKLSGSPIIAILKAPEIRELITRKYEIVSKSKRSNCNIPLKSF